MNKFLLSLLVGTALVSQVSNAGFTNSGTIRSKTSNLRSDIFNNTGTIEGIDYVNLQCEKLIGDGRIVGPKINILAIECEYAGTIECSEECVLTTDTPRDLLKFYFKGTGRLIINKATTESNK